MLNPSVFLFLIYRPTFKTTTPTSRTQLKQQLQREQLQELERQELERRENDRKLSTITAKQPQMSLQLQQQSNVASTMPGAFYSQGRATREDAGGILHTGASDPSTSTSNAQQQQQPQHGRQLTIAFSSGPVQAQNLITDNLRMFFISALQQPQQQDPQMPQTSAALKVPLHIGVDLPPQVLKVI